jgi:hypothetical protein
MHNRGLLFIPDISGFTRFISETEIEHSRLIIQELLEILINANSIGLEISEIEGDAILFYKFGNPPELNELYKQVEEMFCAFHKNISAYHIKRYCQCKACLSVNNLTLKVITHYGEFTSYNVKNFTKLLGKDLIIAHQLLKNEIAQHEYWLVTENVIQGTVPDRLANWMEWEESKKQTEFGEVPYVYTQLGALKQLLSADPVPLADLSEKVKVIILHQEFETDIIRLFHATGDFYYRPLWDEEIKKVEDIGHYLPRIGMKCRCKKANGKEAIIRSNSYLYQEDRIEFSEIDENTGCTTIFVLEKIEKNTTRLTLQFLIRKHWLDEWVFYLIHKRKKEELMNKCLKNLIEVVKIVKIPRRMQTLDES